MRLSIFSSVALGAMITAGMSAFPQPSDWSTAIAKVEVKASLDRAAGTAFVVAIKGGNAYLVTSSHVVAGDSSPKITFQARPDHPVPATVKYPQFEERG